MRLLGLVLAVFVLASTPAQAQLLQWTQQMVGSGPSRRSDHATVYDAARGVTVLFGGYTEVSPNWSSDETWEWNGTAWTQRAVTGPSRRWDHAMAYDAARGVTVLFGGTNGSNSNAETWEWNGTAWTQRVVSGPSARWGHAMAYDAARGVSVLFGGWDGIGNSGETWEWNGTAWTQRMVSGPPPRYWHEMAYDAVRGLSILFGGRTIGNTNTSDTWEWDGTVWTQRMVDGPTPRHGHSMAFDAVRSVIVLIGGSPEIYSYADTWEWNGAGWTQQVVSGPMARRNHAIAYDAARGETFLFGGLSGGAQNGETWELSVPCPAPSIAAQPATQSIYPEGSASFTVAAAGTGTFSYQWHWKHGSGAWTAMIDGVNSDATGVPLFDATGTLSESVTTDPPAADTTYPVIIWDVPLNFRCLVTNSCGSTTTSAEAALIVTCGLPAIESPPANIEVTPCQTATFSVQATSHYPESYRWRRNGVNLNNNTRISGVTTDTLTISPVGYFLGGNYDVVVTNQCGSVTSAVAQLILLDPADFDGDGDSGTDLDIEAFFTCLGGDCCPSCGLPDFDGDGDSGTDLDIETFFRVLGGGSC